MLVRRRARSLAKERGFDPFAVAAISTAASELARNALTHGKGGQVAVEVLLDGIRAGLRMRFEDKGPGIPELDPAVAASHSTATPGLGLYGSRRLVDEFALDSRIDHGTTVTVTKWARF